MKSKYFIHIPKNGGISVRQSLSNIEKVTFGSNYHLRYTDLSEEIKKTNLFFSVVRNPWSRTASRFMYAKQQSNRAWQDNDPRKIYIDQTDFTTYVKDQKVIRSDSFPKIRELVDGAWLGPMLSWFNQLDWLTDEKRQLKSQCLRFEFLQYDLSEYLEMNIPLKEANKTKPKYDYRRMYTDETYKIVDTIFHEDINFFGFTFDGPAIKNYFDS